MRWPLIRAVVLFFAGLVGVGYETVFEHSDRPTLLLLFAAMIGLPVFLNGRVKLDERVDGDNDDE